MRLRLNRETCELTHVDALAERQCLVLNEGTYGRCLIPDARLLEQAHLLIELASLPLAIFATTCSGLPSDSAVARSSATNPAMELPGYGTFAIYLQGGNDHGLWQL